MKSAAIEILVVGAADDGRIAAVEEAFRGRHDFELGRVPVLPDPGEIEHPTSTVVFVPVNGAADPSLPGIAALSAAKVPVVVLAGNEQRELRSRAFECGASDVLFTPLAPVRIEACVMALFHRAVRRGVRCPVDVPAILATAAGVTIDARVMNLSRGGFLATSRTAPPLDTVVRCAFRPPPPASLPVVFARVLACDPDGDAFVFRAQFVGLTADDQFVIGAVVETLGQESGGVANILEQVADLDLPKLREVIEVGLSGMRFPVLTTYERAGLTAPEGTPEAVFGTVALARCRAAVAATVLGKMSDDEKKGLESTLSVWRSELAAAAEVVRGAVASRMTAPPAAMREIKSLQSKITAAADLVERAFAASVGRQAAYSGDAGSDLQESSKQATFEKPPEPVAPAPKKDEAPVAAAPRRAGRVAFGLVAGLLLIAAVAGAIDQRRRAHSDPARDEIETVAPRATVAGVRIRTWYPNDGNMIAIVDRSWYQVPRQGRESVALEMREKLAPGDAPLVVRDYAGRTIAVVTKEKQVSFGRRRPAAAQPSPTPPSPPE